MPAAERSLPLYVVDAFTDRRFRGNPAAVVLLPAWLPDATLQAIAGENNLSETAFLVRQGETFGLRWFTPTVEVDLCGHATLASAFVLFEEREVTGAQVVFETRSGLLKVEGRGELLAMDFPSRPPTPAAPSRSTEPRCPSRSITAADSSRSRRATPAPACRRPSARPRCAASRCLPRSCSSTASCRRETERPNRRLQ